MGEFWTRHLFKKGKIWQRLILFTVSIVIITACKPALPSVNHPNDHLNKKGFILTRSFYTSDGKTEFIVHNNEATVPKEQLDFISNRINKSYKLITTYFKHPTYQWPKKIDFYLKLGYGVSYSDGAFGSAKNSVTVYEAYNKKHIDITHELTHELLGYSSNAGFFTQEGLAEYFQDQYGTGVIADLPLDSIAKYLVIKHKDIPLTSLTSDASTSYFRSNNILEKDESYFEAGSFVGFLIKKYDREKFYHIYNKPGLKNNLSKVYGKSLKELQSEWLMYLDNDVTSLNKNQKQALFSWFPNLKF